MIRKMIVGFAIAMVSMSITRAEPATTKSGADKATADVLLGSGLVSPSRPDAALSLLRKRVPLVDWNETPFDDILTWLRDLSDNEVNVVAKWGPLGVEGASPEKAVTLKIKNATVAEILLEVQEQLSESGELRFVAEKNTLKFSTKQDFDKNLFIRVYDATDILNRIPNFGQSAPGIDLQRTRSSGSGGGGGQSVFSGGSGGGREQDEGGEQAEQKLEERLKKLQTALQELIEPESWKTPQGGGKGTITVYQSSLIVRATIEVHEQIAGYFAYGD